MKAWSYPVTVGVFLLVVGETSIIQGIISLVTASIPVVGPSYISYSFGGAGAAGLFFALLGFAIQVLGFVLVLGIRRKERHMDYDSKIPLTA